MNLLKKIDFYIKEAFLNERSRIYLINNNFIIFFVFVSVGAMIAESMYVDSDIPAFLKYLEYFILFIFSLDYILNIYAARSKKKYIFSFMGIVDLLAVLPAYFGFINLSGIKIFQFAKVLRFLRFMRLLRMLRVLKLSKGITREAKNSHNFSDMDSFKISLQIYASLFFFVVIFFSFLMYYVESGVDSSSFRTIPDAIWWCLETVTNIGSDMKVQTLAGKIISSFTMVSGLILFALLMNVVGKSLMVFIFGSSKIDRK